MTNRLGLLRVAPMGHRISLEMLAALGSRELEPLPGVRGPGSRSALGSARGAGGCKGCSAPMPRSGALPVPVIDGGALAPGEARARSGAGGGLVVDGRGAVDGGA